MNSDWETARLLALRRFPAVYAKIKEREGAKIGVVLFGEIQVFHRPHPSPDTDKGAVSSIRKWLERNGVKP